MIPAQLKNRVEVVGDCWVWKGHRASNGYGRIRLGEKEWMAHRVMYQIWMGKVPEGLELDHLCRNRACLNPKHLEPVTHAVNMQRGIAGKIQSEKWAKRKFCKEGHPMSGYNLIVRHRGNIIGRQCRECQNENRRKRRALGGVS